MKIFLKAHPNSKNPRIETNTKNNIDVYVREPSKENKANIAIIKALSQHYKVPKSSVTLISGAKNKNKVFEITNDLT